MYPFTHSDFLKLLSGSRHSCSHACAHSAPASLDLQCSSDAAIPNHTINRRSLDDARTSTSTSVVATGTTCC